MPYNNIPLRPRNRKFRMEAKEMDCLTWYVLSGCKKEEAYGIFCLPELKALADKGSRQAAVQIREQAAQTFASKDFRDYISAYRATLEGRDVEQAELSDDDKEKRKVKAVQNFTDKVVDKMNGDLETVEEMDAVAKLADRVGVLGDGEEVQEAPRRYLPQSCNQGCRYRLFVEENISNGNIIDECQYCKYKAYANENGVVYDNMNMLNIPQNK